MWHRDRPETPHERPDPMDDPGDLHPLDRLILRELVVRILHSLTPGERTIARLRLEGLSDAQIGRRLGVERTAVTLRMIRAQQRIVDQIPSAAYLLEGRQHERARRPPTGIPLDQDWICDWLYGDGCESVDDA